MPAVEWMRLDPRSECTWARNLYVDNAKGTKALNEICANKLSHLDEPVKSIYDFSGFCSTAVPPGEVWK